MPRPHGTSNRVQVPRRKVGGGKGGLVRTKKGLFKEVTGSHGASSGSVKVIPGSRSSRWKSLEAGSGLVCSELKEGKQRGAQVEAGALWAWVGGLGFLLSALRAHSRAG